jgi:hypothetical protein
MKRIDILAVLSTLEGVETELEQLSYDEEWFCTDTTDSITDAKERLKSALSPQPIPEK